MNDWTQARADAHNARVARAKAILPSGPMQRLTSAASPICAVPPPAGSLLEERFVALWALAAGPPLNREFRFAPPRRWRADFCHQPSGTLIEIEGGAFGGRHTRPGGFQNDAEKYLAAWLAGWSVVRLTSKQLTIDIVRRVADKLR